MCRGFASAEYFTFDGSRRDFHGTANCTYVAARHSATESDFQVR